MNAAELSDRYERIRRRVTDGGPGRADALVVLRRQGLRAWIEQVTTAPVPRRSEEAAASAPSLIEAKVDRSPLVSLCADMLLAKVISQEAR